MCITDCYGEKLNYVENREVMYPQHANLAVQSALQPEVRLQPARATLYRAGKAHRTEVTHKRMRYPAVVPRCY